MLKQAKDQKEYLRFVNEGLDSVAGLLNVLPITDEKILADIKNFTDALNQVQKVYGEIPKSKEAFMQELHDKAIAESLKILGNISEYAKKQDQNAQRIFHSSNLTSPKGAARLNAQTNAQILHTLNQLLKINSQMLKLQSAQFASTNKQGKESVVRFQRINQDIKKGMSGLKASFNIPRFD